MNLWRTIHAAVTADPHGDPRTIAEGVVDELTRDHLITLIADEVANHQRIRVRLIETNAFRPVFNPQPSESNSRPDPLATLRGEHFALGNGVTVDWHLATAEQHQERIEILESMRVGLLRTIERHQEAVTMIRAANVTCLAELETPPAKAARKRKARRAEKTASAAAD